MVEERRRRSYQWQWWTKWEGDATIELTPRCHYPNLWVVLLTTEGVIRACDGKLPLRVHSGPPGELTLIVDLLVICPYL